MAKLRRRVAVPKGATVGRLAVIEAQTTTDADNARVKQTADPVALHPAVLLHSQLISRLGRDQRAGAILQLQRSYGNTLVAPAILAARRAARIQRQPDDGDSSGSLATAVVGLGRLVAEGEQLVLAALQGGKGISENGLTDELFWIEHPRLEGQRGNAGRQIGRGQVSPDPPAHALGGLQVAFAVQPGEHPPVRGDRVIRG